MVSKNSVHHDKEVLAKQSSHHGVQEAQKRNIGRDPKDIHPIDLLSPIGPTFFLSLPPNNAIKL
jgi:hypothetical protein